MLRQNEYPGPISEAEYQELAYEPAYYSPSHYAPPAQGFANMEEYRSWVANPAGWYPGRTSIPIDSIVAQSLIAAGVPGYEQVGGLLQPINLPTTPLPLQDIGPSLTPPPIGMVSNLIPSTGGVSIGQSPVLPDETSNRNWLIAGIAVLAFVLFRR